MTQDDVIRLARKIASSLASRMSDENGETHGEELYCMAFDDIVDAVKLVTAHEREACAKLVSDIEWKCIMDDVDDTSLKEISKAIRARGQV